MTCFNLFHLFLIRNPRACAKGGKTSRALTLLQVAKDKGLPVDSYCYTAVIDGKKLESNQCLFDFFFAYMPFCVMVLACAKSKKWEKALELLEEMQKQGIAPTEVTYR
jgi:pentatricopeptide repeat protein